MQTSAVLYRKSLVGRRPSHQASAPTPKIVERNYILTSEIVPLEKRWIENCESRMLSEDTTDLRHVIIFRLTEFLKDESYTVCGELELRRFMHHLATVGGRRPGHSKKERLEPSTVKTYHAHLVIFFKFLVGESVLTSSPMVSILPPKVPKHKITPFTPEQIRSLIDAAKHGFYPKRDKAIILLLLDTGIRAAELCGLCWGDVDLTGRKCSVIGKGNKPRDVYFSATTLRAITDYRREETLANEGPNTPLFYSDRGSKTGAGFTESGLLQLIVRLGERAGVTGVRCSPHTFRHTFALNFLRSGGDVFALKEMLGHEDLKMTQRYVSLASSDMRLQSLSHSPVEFMLKRK